MPSTGLSGPFVLTAEEVDRLVEPDRIGAYALGYLTDEGFLVERIGRSDNDLNGRLKSYLDEYPIFKASYFATSKAAFEKECNLYHDFSPADNVIHPDRPDGTTWLCPRCYLFG